MKPNNSIPQDKTLDNTLALLQEGFQFIPNRRKQLDSDIFQTRLFGQKVICMSGNEAAELFYDNERFQRKGAAPKRIQKTLFGENAIQGMDGEDHKHRKRMFLSLMTPERLNHMVDLTLNQWKNKVIEWEKANEVVLFDETEEMMCRAACEWAGIPIREKEVNQRSKDLGAMIDAFGGVGQRYRQGKHARKRTENWIKDLIKEIRSGELNPLENTASYIVAWHRERNGKKLSPQMAAIELINVIRPIVAIGRYITFGALALHEYPETHKKLEEDKEEYSKMFVQEVRRFYPFGPFTGARVRKHFTWKQCRFKKGRLVLLDIYGTNHHPDLWEDPNDFKPERFKNWEGSPFRFIPQGGGDHYIGHRCAGEWLTVMVMKESMKFITTEMEYEVPPQNLNYSMVRMPSIPKSRFVIRKVRPK
ncbi:cytochrome P450 [Alteribacillus sp. YIM 98480]|uniref:cytochrome P450 n=1 Tax=Alteribacillus sp. YIM 98480 TaxID=2606599 RepID=UPI00131BAC56|nr:cytochrome P450 [Alteribacillus sp. YIM 98480]